GGNEADFVIDANGTLTGYKCTGANAVIPSSVKSIGVGAFRNCATLTSVSIPQSVTSIGALAFAGCTALKSVAVAWDTPVGITSLVFSGVSLDGVTLRVPSGRESVYRGAAVWRLFGTVATGNAAVPEQSVGVRCAAGVLSVDSPAAEQVTVYSAGGSLLFRAVKPSGPATFALPHLPRGVAIVAGSSGWTKKIYMD
ncbi:MAG: leucine-rich repeat domain-containing protein, partial [Tannerella sp.]|nr:leucine-rich repeat domain-containing protein [Tannerella sp.]